MKRLTLFIGFSALSACVTTGTHEAALAELEKTKQELQNTQKQLDAERDELNKKQKELEDKLTVAMDQNNQLVTKVSSMGQNVEQLLGEKDKIAEERETMKKEIEELRRMRAAAEARNQEFRKVVEKLAKMIDAGSVEVKVRNGNMLVAMSSDVLFPPGGTKLKAEAVEAIKQLAGTIATLKGRRFQVVGHSDATPINTARFPSNWELSTQRAIEVVKVMIEAGVPPEMLAASGSAEFDPLVTNDSPENKEMNRRIEVVFVPKIDELPGFDQLLADKKN
jgi:chemotaxis protein MotB